MELVQQLIADYGYLAPAASTVASIHESIDKSKKRDKEVSINKKRSFFCLNHGCR